MVKYVEQDREAQNALTSALNKIHVEINAHCLVMTKSKISRLQKQRFHRSHSHCYLSQMMHTLLNRPI